MSKYKYGYIPDDPDDRDLRYSISKPVAGLAASSNLIPSLPPCYDQLQTSSCTGNGTVGELQGAQVRAGEPPVMLSRLFAYYNARIAEGNQDQDSGAQIRDVIKGCNVYGMVPESVWPFDEANVTVKPPPSVYAQAVTGKIHFYASVDLSNPDNVKVALCHNIPVVFGCPVFPYIESDEMAQTGILQMPADGEQSIGGHCMVIVGHDDATQMYWVRNSWGTQWAINGNCKIPYAYITQFGSDGWAIRLK